MALINKFKAATPKGHERMIMVIFTIFNKLLTLKITMPLYQSVLVVFKTYVLLFQSERSLIHTFIRGRLSV